MESHLNQFQLNKSLPTLRQPLLPSQIPRLKKYARGCKPQKSNIKQHEKQALKQQNINKNTLILPADKGNAIVIMGTDGYKEKVYNVLEPTIYKKFKTQDLNFYNR